jgi:hypothetical protein
MPNFQNTGLVDFITNPNGSVQKASTKALSDFVNATKNGALTTPYNTWAQGITGVAGTANTLYLGDGEYYVTNYNADGKTIKLAADTQLLAVIKSTSQTYVFFRNSNSAAHTLEITGIVIDSPPIVRLVPQSNDIIYKLNKVVFQANATLHLGDVTALNHSDIICKGSFIFEGGGSGGAISSGVLYDSVVRTFINTGYGSGFRNSGIDRGYIAGNITDFQLSTDNNPASIGLSFVTRIKNCIINPNAVIKLTLASVVRQYTGVEAAKLANPTWFENCVSGDIGYLGNSDNNEHLIARDSDIYTKINGYQSAIIRPGKTSWIFNESTAAGTHNNTAWVGGKLQATAATGFYSQTIYLQARGLINPIVWLSRGLDMLSHTPTANDGSIQNNPTKLTFMADYKPVGGSYSGVKRAFVYNTKIGVDANGNTSGEAGFNPLTLVGVVIEEIAIDQYVVQGANSATAGVYGYYVAPSIENFCSRIVDQLGVGVSGVDVEVTTVSDSRTLTTDVNGFTDFAHITGLNSANIEMNDTRYFAISESETKNFNYNFYQYETRKKYRYRVRSFNAINASNWAEATLTV